MSGVFDVIDVSLGWKDIERNTNMSFSPPWSATQPLWPASQTLTFIGLEELQLTAFMSS